MTINLIYIATIIIGCYVAIKTFIETRQPIILGFLGILIFSLGLEIQWLNLGNFITDLTDIFWTTRDILWTIIVIIAMMYCMEHKMVKRNK